MTADRGAAGPTALADTFEIYRAWSGTTLTVRPGQTALQALVDAGVAVEPGCQTGGCGMCVTAYFEGDVIHKDGCLSIFDRERYFCPCVSRARTRIVLAQ
jgi:ferredoxin